MGNRCCDIDVCSSNHSHGILSKTRLNQVSKQQCEHTCCSHHHQPVNVKAQSVIAPGGLSRCDQLSTPDEQFLSPEEHQEETPSEDGHEHNCQLGMYFAQSQMEITFANYAFALFEIERFVLVTSQRLDSMFCFIYEVRGPPAVIG